MALSSPQSDLLSQIERAVTNDPSMAEICTKCLQGAAAGPFYQVINNLLYWKPRIVVPPQPDLVSKILTEFHSSPLGGHSGIAQTMACVASMFFWPDMAKDIKSFVSSCLLCQQAKASTTLPAGLLQSLPVPTQIWEDVAMDFITGLSASPRYTVIMVVVNHLSKYGHFAPIKG